jgi:probable F420-dependent oxidoreductase
VEIGVVIQPRSPDYRQIRAAWVRAEELGADGIYVWDHFYPPFDDPAAGVANFECWGLLAAMAEVTSRVRIGPLVGCVPYRNPDLLADLARTVDHISGGRVVLGLGPGNNAHDFAEYGYVFKPAKERLADFEAALAVIAARLPRLVPPPVQPRIPLLIGSRGRRVGLRIVAEHADIWHAPLPLSELGSMSAALDEWCGRVGRDPGSIRRWTGLRAGELERAPEYQALGFSQLILDVPGPDYDFGPLAELVAWRDRTVPG